jgi:GTP-binding protein
MFDLTKAAFKASYGTKNQLPVTDKPEVVFSGKSNVGKSSLINKLLNRKNLARVSASPGKTVTVNFFDCIDGYIVDLPGYGYAKRSFAEKKRWSELVEGYFSGTRNIKLVFQLIDFRHPPSKEDLDMLRFLSERTFPFTVVLTKADKLNKGEKETRRNALETELPNCSQLDIVEFSAKTGSGTESLKERIVT